MIKVAEFREIKGKIKPIFLAIINLLSHRPFPPTIPEYPPPKPCLPNPSQKSLTTLPYPKLPTSSPNAPHQPPFPRIGTDF